MKQVVLLRHGESQWNKENRFTGWTDVDLSAKGMEEAREGGRVLKAEGYHFDVAYTSVLKRAIRTLWTVLDEMDLMWIPVYRSWRLNERHYGALQGLNKAETAAKFGEDQVKIWRRSYDVRPPELTPDDERYPGRDPRYRSLTPAELPAYRMPQGYRRALPAPLARHHRPGHSKRPERAHRRARQQPPRAGEIPRPGLRADIVELNIPTGMPLVYELDDDLKPLRHYYLGDQAKAEEAARAVASQARAR